MEFLRKNDTVPILSPGLRRPHALPSTLSLPSSVKKPGPAGGQGAARSRDELFQPRPL